MESDALKAGSLTHGCGDEVEGRREQDGQESNSRPATEGSGEPKGFNMLDAYIIEHIKREDRRCDEDRPRLYIELPVVWRPAQPEAKDTDDTDYGTTVIIPLTPQIPLHDRERDGDFEGEDAA